MNNEQPDINSPEEAANAAQSGERTLRVAIIVPTRNRCELLEEILQTLLAQEYPSDSYEILVVDDGGEDDTPDMVARLAKEAKCSLRYMLVPGGGPALARNRGLAEVDADAVAVVDSDTKLDPNWLKHTTAVMASDEKVGVVSGKLVYATRPDYLNSFGGALGLIGLAWDQHEGEEQAKITEPVECLWVSTAAALVRRSLLDKIGGFDGPLFYAFEDTDLGWQANLYGYKVLCIPQAVAHHCVNEKVARSDSRIVTHYCKNRLRLMLKNYGMGRLIMYLPIYFAYVFVDLIVRGPRIAKLRALLWNLTNLPDTLRQRRRIQRDRVPLDRDLAHLFTKRYFPPKPLGGLRRRPTEDQLPQMRGAPTGSDDRV